MPSLSARLVLPITAVLVGLSVWAAAHVQAHAAHVGSERLAQARVMLTGMLDQQNALRGYRLTPRESFLRQYATGERQYSAARAAVLRSTGSEPTVRRMIDRVDPIVDRWHALADEELAEIRAHGPREVRLRQLLDRTALIDEFRGLVATLQIALAEQREREQREATWLCVALSVLTCVAVIGLGLLWTRRRERADRAAGAREEAYRATQARFAQTLQLVASEDEANTLVKRHLEQARAGRRVTVMSASPSEDELRACTELPDDSPLALALRGARADACVAVRLGRVHEHAAADSTVPTCELCSVAGGLARCSPLVVSGKLIGAVLTAQEQPFDACDRRCLDESVTIAAPVLANVRAVAVAETRAATDDLTGLPNRRAVNDALRRMIAQAGRSVSSLTAIAIDLDHFKQVNDRYGHDIGDDVLRAVAATLQQAIRASDFAGRHGGEEFIVLAPDTAPQGGVVLAEHLREAIAQIRVPGLDRAISASLGVATYPHHAATGELLMRQADRALYAAKERGRDRVELTEAHDAGAGADAAGDGSTPA